MGRPGCETKTTLKGMTMTIAELCQYFSPTTLAAMYCDMWDSQAGGDLDISDRIAVANYAAVEAARDEIHDALIDLVGEDTAEELIDAERAKG